MNRNEVHLSDEILEILTNLAKKDGRKLKNYLEKVLIRHAERSNGKKDNTEHNTTNARSHNAG